MPTVSPDAPTAICSSSGESTCTPHLHAAASARQCQEGQRSLGGQGPVHAETVVHQDPVGAALDGELGGRRIAAHQRRLDPQVAHDLQIRGDAARRVEGAAGGRAADQELGEVRRRRVEGAGRGHRDVPVQADAAVREGGQQGAVLPADGHQGVLDLEVALCSCGVSTKLVAVRLLTVRSAAGSTPGLFSRSVTRWPRLLKLAMRG